MKPQTPSLPEAPSRQTVPAGPEQLLLNGTSEAEKVLEQLAALRPTYADVRYRLGLLKLSSRQLESAEHEFEEALGIHPGYRSAYYALRLVWHLREETPAGPVACVGEPPREEWIWAAVDQAYALWNSGQDPMGAFESERAKSSTMRHHYGALFAHKRGDAAGARRHLEQATAVSSVTAAILARHGAQDGPTSWMSRFEGLLWSPLAADLYAYLGRIYARNGLREQSLLCHEHAHLVCPDDARYWRHQAETAVVFGEEDEAIRLFSRSVELDPDCIDARVALGFEYAAQGFLDEACREFERAVTLAPDYADVQYNLGLLYSGQERTLEAIERFRRALAINPAYLPARRNLAAALHESGLHEEALREGERILRQGFASADLHVQMAQDYLALSRTEEALDELLKAEALDASYAPTFFWLGTVYRRMGCKNKARSAWSRYLERTGPAQEDAGRWDAEPGSAS